MQFFGKDLNTLLNEICFECSKLYCWRCEKYIGKTECNCYNFCGQYYCEDCKTDECDNCLKSQCFNCGGSIFMLYCGCTICYSCVMYPENDKNFYRCKNYKNYIHINCEKDLDCEIILEPVDIDISVVEEYFFLKLNDYVKNIMTSLPHRD